METLLTLLVQLVIAGLIVYVLLWAIRTIGLPEPFAKIATVLVVLFAVIYLLMLLMGMPRFGRL